MTSDSTSHPDTPPVAELLAFARLVLRGLESGAIKARPVIDMDPDAEQAEMRPLAAIARAAIAKATGADQ